MTAFSESLRQSLFGLRCCPRSNRFPPKEKAGVVRRWDWNGCFAGTLPSNVSASPTKVPKTPFTTARQSGDLPVSTSRAKARRYHAPAQVSSPAGETPTGRAHLCTPQRASVPPRLAARSKARWMRQSSPPRPRPRTERASVIQRCIRPRKASSGILA